MKRTEITYKKTRDDFYNIISIKNCATRIDIMREFGYAVASEYFEHFPYYYDDPEEDCVIINDQKLSIGYSLTANSFNLLINCMKNSGNRLMAIVKRNTKVKTILI